MKEAERICKWHFADINCQNLIHKYNNEMKWKFKWITNNEGKTYRMIKWVSYPVLLFQLVFESVINNFLIVSFRAKLFRNIMISINQYYIYTLAKMQVR